MKLLKKYNRFSIESNDNYKSNESNYIDLKPIELLKLKSNTNTVFKKENKVINTPQFNDNIENQLGEGYSRELFQDILEQAILKNTSDIHIEPFEKDIVIRFRIDGKLEVIDKYPMSIYPYLSSVIKLDMSMNITEKRIPQDGRRNIIINNVSVDIRASSVPTVHGEKIVLRILNRNSFLKEKSELGFSIEAINKINNIINKKVGILLVTGSTGSGKTTTVYSLLNDLRLKNKNIMTIEDPVEYRMDGINQIPVNIKKGITFENGLRAILRQDPDIIMLGEIRDIETAKIAIRAATTGHLVISTMHTNDAISSIARLIDMEIPSYLINASLIGVISQKLVRKLCPECGENIIQDNIDNKLNTKGDIGCENCNNGYLGRTAIYEILEINEDIKKCIQEVKEYEEIREVAIKNNMITFEDSIKRVLNEKKTTIEECTMIQNIG